MSILINNNDFSIKTHKKKQDIKRHDQGVFRCRIDFRASQAQNYHYNLSVISKSIKIKVVLFLIWKCINTYYYYCVYSNFIVLPEQPIVLDRWGRQLNGTTIGPKQEEDNVTITCRVVGGKFQKRTL